MNNLESIVPPVELCKQIPEGAFVDSALVYSFDARYDGSVDLVPRFFAVPEKSIPAPLLEEVLAAMANNGVLVRDEANGTWTVIQWDGLHDKRENDARAATAALRLFLEVNNGL